MAVTFGTGLPSSARSVKITATPKQASNATTVLKYEFLIKNWFIWADTYKTYKSAASICTQYGRLPDVSELTERNIISGGKTGIFLGEWGGLDRNEFQPKHTNFVWGREHISTDSAICYPIIHWYSPSIGIVTDYTDPRVTDVDYVLCTLN